MKASYKVICEKLGFDPLANPPKSDGDDWIINDNEENIYGVLDSDEIDLLIEIESPHRIFEKRPDCFIEMFL